MADKGTFLGPLDWGNWLYGLFAGGIGGGATAVYGGLIAGGIDSHFALGSPNSWKLMGLMFAMSFLKDAALYLKQNPLPAIKTVTTVETVQHTSNPTATVITTVEQTKVSPASEEIVRGGFGSTGPK